VIRFTLPLHLPSVANLREHWAKRSKRAKVHRLWGFCASRRAQTEAAWPWPWQDDFESLEVTIRRVAPRALDDDNAASAAKGLRDGIADALGVDDRDPRVTWRYEQRKGPSCVEVEIVPVGEVTNAG
jgi:hypothetical protein